LVPFLSSQLFALRMAIAHRSPPSIVSDTKIVITFCQKKIVIKNSEIFENVLFQRSYSTFCIHSGRTSIGASRCPGTLLTHWKINLFLLVAVKTKTCLDPDTLFPSPGYPYWLFLVPSLWMCLDGERISERISLFGLVVENSMRLVISREMWEQCYFLLFQVGKMLFGW
jgi:hypothetical protein